MIAGARRIRYDTGNPEAPDDPFGRILLILDRTGLAKLGNWHRGGTDAWSGIVTLEVMDEVLRHLAAGGFPDWRPRSITPGATYTLSVDADRSYSMMDSAHSSNPEFKVALELLNGVVRQLSGDAIPIGRLERKVVLSRHSVPIDDVK